MQPERHSGDLVIGALFADRYQVEAILGRGGMGTVYRVRDFELAEVVALKVLSLRPEPPPVAVLRFREEVRLARRVTHPNVARVYDIGEHGEHLFLTMELVDGEALRTLLRAGGPFAPARAVAVARALCEGLHAAHAAGVVHRDLKPANILVDRGGRVVITDFGIAMSLRDHSDLTVGAIGTPRYMAPEQAAGAPVDERTDLYALGLVVSEMLLGEPPERGLDGLSDRLRAAAPPALAAVVLRCLSVAAEARPGSAREVASLLAAADEGGASDVSTTRPLLPQTQRPPASASPSGAPPTGATGAPPARVIAVLPFHYRGPPDLAYLGDAFADVLIDTLSSSRGAKVLGSGATSKHRDARDPQAAGAALGAYAVVHGAVEVGADRARITARLLDVESGVQLWNGRHEGAVAGLFDLQESVARRLAEQLRVELTMLPHLEGAPREAVEQYLTVRGKSRVAPYTSMVSAVESLERCLALAPSFAPALAAHAVACLRCWFFSLGPPSGRDWEKASEASVARALAEAPMLADSHLAAGIHATQYGRYRAAVGSLERALAIAPTHPDALEYLGILQCEAGQWGDGEARLRLADELDPTLALALVYLARQHALGGRHDEAGALIAELLRRRGAANRTLALSRARLATWRGDREALRALLAEGEMSDAEWWGLIHLYARSALGEMDPAVAAQLVAAAQRASPSPRAFTFVTQLAAEAFAAGGAIGQAWTSFQQAAESVLVDLSWVDHCPSLAPLRELHGFASVRGLVRARAEAIWTSTPR